MPPPRPHALPRTGLVDRLRAVSAPGRLTLVVAGAGWGKTTLVASWARAEPGPTAWFSADATDADPVRFWGAVVAALDAVAPDLRTRSADLLAVPGTSTVTDVVPALVDELTALRTPLTLVVDDYHLAASPEVQRGIAVLATHLPATLRLVLVSRTEPELPLARLRGQGRVAELGVDDLRLSAAENAQLLAAEAAATGTVWTPDDAARLHDHTEGWVIGVHLGVLSRRSHPATDGVPAPRPIRPDGDRARHLVDYLRHEVLAPLPDDLRLVLRRTAVLDEFDADLAAVVTGRPDAPALLARAEREQLFVVPLDDRGDRYRFHHLFTEVLRDDLARAEPGLVPQLHARAARWLADHEQPVAAVRHALASDDRALAAALVARHAPVLTRIGQVETALGWFRALGDDTCRADPRLAVARALTGAHTGRPHEIASWTAVAEQALGAPPDGSEPAPETLGIRIEIAMMRWAAAHFAGDATAALRHAAQARRLLPAGSGPPSAFILLAVGSSQFRTGAVDESWATLLDAESAAEHRGEPLAIVAARGLRALQAALDHRPEEAAGLAASAEAVARMHGLAEHFNTATLRVAQGWVALHGRRPRRALEHFRRSLEMVRRSGLSVEAAELLTATATAEERLGWHALAREHRAEARRVLARCPDPGQMWADPRDVEEVPTAPSRNGVTLSRRQTEILRLLADALTTVEIGEQLAVSPRTVEAHLRTLYRKLGVRSRIAATRYAVEHGLIDGSTPLSGDSR